MLLWPWRGEQKFEPVLQVRKGWSLRQWVQRWAVQMKAGARGLLAGLGYGTRLNLHRLLSGAKVIEAVIVSFPSLKCRLSRLPWNS